LEIRGKCAYICSPVLMKRENNKGTLKYIRREGGKKR